MVLLLAILTGVLYSASFYLILRRSLTKLVFGLVLLSHASNVLILTLGGIIKGRPPVIAPGEEQITSLVADPLPQAMILTSIVISFGIQAFAIVLIRRVYEETGGDDMNRMTTTDKM